jgi:SAM-dependent methyltransferase
MTAEANNNSPWYLEETACAVCGADRKDVLFSKGEDRTWWVRKCADTPDLPEDAQFAVVRCQQCAHVFVSPRLREDINSDIYARYWRDKEPERIVRHDYSRFVCGQLAKIVDRGRLLDFGCGWGLFLNEADKDGWQAVGLEVDERKVAFIRENGLEAVCADMLDSPFEAGSFDAVVAEQVFEHLYDPTRMIQALHHVLRPGGVLFISVPNWGGIARRKDGANWNMLHPASHVQYFDRRTLTDFFDRNGFDVVPGPVVSRFSGPREVAHRAKLMVENLAGFYPQGLAMFAVKR